METSQSICNEDSEPHLLICHKKFVPARCNSTLAFLFIIITITITKHYLIRGGWFFREALGKKAIGPHYIGTTCLRTCLMWLQIVSEGYNRYQCLKWTSHLSLKSLWTCPLLLIKGKVTIIFLESRDHKITYSKVIRMYNISKSRWWQQQHSTLRLWTKKNIRTNGESGTQGPI